MKTLFFTSIKGLERNLNSEHENSYSFLTDTEIQSLTENRYKSLRYLSNKHERSAIAIQIMLDRYILKEFK